MSKQTNPPQPDPFDRSKAAAEERRRQEALRDYERSQKAQREQGKK